MVEAISIRAFAQLDGCDEKVVRRKIQSGHLVALENGKLDASLVGTAWRKRNAAQIKPQIADNPTVRTTPVRTVRPDETPEDAAERISQDPEFELLSKAEAERKKENFLALLRELEYDLKSGAVASVDDVVLSVVAEYAKVRNKILSIPTRAAPRMAMLRSAEEARAYLDNEIALVLQELTLDGFADVDPASLRRSVQERFKTAH